MFGEMSLAAAILTVALVLVLAYWCSRMLGRNWIRASAGKNLKVIEQLQLGPDRRLLLIKLKDHAYLIGVSPAGIQMVAEVDGELDEPGPGDMDKDSPGFGALMEKYASLHQKRKEGDK